MNDRLSSSRFMVTTVFLDLLILAAAYSEALPFGIPEPLVAVGLFVVSPAIAYVVARTTE